MKIAFFGSSLVSAYWNGAATYYRGLLSALAARGHRITFYEPDAYERQQHRDIADPDYAQVVVYPARQPVQVVDVVRQASASDLIVKASGVGVFDSVLEAAVLELRRPHARVVFWDVDAAATLERIDEDRSDALRSLIPEYDAIFTYGGSSAVVGAYLSLGAKACHPIYNALDPASHFPVAPERRFAAALGFLGNRLPDREARVREFFFKPAVALKHRDFILGGNGWQDGEMTNVRCLGHVYTADHNAFNSSPLAILNICRDSMARCGFSPPTRLFEAAGAGACLITDDWQGIETFLEPEHECLVARNGTEVAALLDDLDPSRARNIGQAALSRIRAEHTYAQRAEVVDAIIGEL
jgi:spore maturation protein CgeB